MYKCFSGSPYKITKKVENLSNFWKTCILCTTTCTYSLFDGWGVPFDVAEQAYRVCFSIRSIVPPYLHCFQFFSILPKTRFDVDVDVDNFCNLQIYLHPLLGRLIYILNILPAEFLRISRWRCGEIIFRVIFQLSLLRPQLSNTV